MLSLGGQPFIDIRLSFNSYLPKNLPSYICEKLVNGWNKKLADNPELHDKIEFEIAIPNYLFDFKSHLKYLYENLLNEKEIDEAEIIYRNHLREITNKNSEGSIQYAEKKISLLKKYQENYKDHSFKNLNKLIDHCINFGTIPFSILARHGFIANSLMRSLIRLEILSENDVENFYRSIKTVATNVVIDLNKANENIITRETFLNKYRHLRPGTYDITSKRYDQLDNELFTNKKSTYIEKETDFNLPKLKIDKINKLLKEKICLGKIQKIFLIM